MLEDRASFVLADNQERAVLLFCMFLLQFEQYLMILNIFKDHLLNLLKEKYNGIYGDTITFEILYKVYKLEHLVSKLLRRVTLKACFKVVYEARNLRFNTWIEIRYCSWITTWYKR